MSNQLSTLIQDFKNQQGTKYGTDFYTDIILDQKLTKIVFMTEKLKAAFEEFLGKHSSKDSIQIVSLEESAGIEAQVKIGAIDIFTKREVNPNQLADQLVTGESIRLARQVLEGDWVPIVVHNDFENQSPKELGWIKADYNKIDTGLPKAVKEPVKSATFKNFYQLIKNFLTQNSGIKYHLGGKSKETGFDCSGFSQIIIQNLFGLWLPRLSRWQALSGKEISENDIKPSDLIFFRNLISNKISHVGIIYEVEKDQLPVIAHCALKSNGIVVEDLNQASWVGQELKIDGYRRISSLS